MLQGKFKFPQQVPFQFPHKLESKEEENVRIDQGFEYGKELETFLPDELGLDAEIELSIESPFEKFDGEILEKGKHNKDTGDVEIDDKLSDLEYEVSQHIINVEKLQRVVSSGIPDGGGLRATIWKTVCKFKEKR